MIFLSIQIQVEVEEEVAIQGDYLEIIINKMTKIMEMVRVALEVGGAKEAVIHGKETSM